MVQCPIEKPQCKRTIMSSNKPYEEKKCPLNIKPRCSLVPPRCPLLPEDNSCGLSKLVNPDAPVDVSQCPGKSPCPLAPGGCPITISCSDSFPKENGSKNDINDPSNTDPLCPIENCIRSKKVSSKPEQKALKSNKTEDYGSLYTKPTTPIRKGTHKCPVSSSRRPWPCSECILGELSKDAEGDEIKKCPFLKIADVCGPCCKCEDVPEVKIEPTCPFLPKPCACCTTPRCPLSRKPDCILNPKPQCCILNPPCCCGVNCLGQPCTPVSCPPICPPEMPHSCICGLCKPNCFPCLLNPPSCGCSSSPPSKPTCPLNPPRCLCGGCSLFPCCLPKPSCCLCGKCPLGSPCPLSQLLCKLSPQKCSPPCCLSPPSCVCCPSPCPLTQPHNCPIITDPCPLLKKPICPPIPPPCSLNNYDIKPPPPKTTFHVPICSQYKPPCKLHLKQTGQDELICPFSPHPCPLGPTCPFPISTGGNRPNSESAGNQNVNLISQNENLKSDETCPGSKACGLIPAPKCPAAEVLCPEKFERKKKVKKECCPFKECMKKPECPLSKAIPDVDCPLKDSSDCPLSKEPDCPVMELSKKCPLTPKCFCLPSSCNIDLQSNTPKSALQDEDCLLEKNQLLCPLNKNPECPLTKITADCPLAPKPECPLTKITADCPLAPKPECPLTITANCPLAPKPDCPLAEFAPKPDCPIAPKKCPLSNSLDCVISKRDSKQADIYDSNPKLDGTSHVKSKSVKNNFKSLSSDCPLSGMMPKQNCPLAPPECPLTPKPKCPLTKKNPPCPLSLNKRYCPVEYPPCEKFPEGRCPMDPMNVCDCDYPVSPCMLPPQCGDPDAIAPPQYCVKDNCCMGLPLPPFTQESSDSYGNMRSDDGFFYKFQDTKPGKEETKHYVQVLKEPPELTIGLFGKPKKRLHDNWNVVKYGEGFKRCKTIAQKLSQLGQIANRESQFKVDDFPPSPEELRMMENKKIHAREEKEVEQMRLELRRGKII